MERTAEGAQRHELLDTHLETKPPSVGSFHGTHSDSSPAWPGTHYVPKVGLELVIFQLQQGLIYPVVPYTAKPCAL